MRSDADRLADILDACARVERIVDRGEDHLRAGDEPQLALVHLIQIIGEAAARVSADLRGRHGDIPWREIAAMRNQVVHRYFDIDLDLVWNIATRDVPELAALIRRVLNDID